MALTITILGKYASGTATNGNWLQINLPPFTCSVQVEVDGAAYIDGSGGGYTDGAARSSGGRSTISGETVTLPVRMSQDAQAIYVAGNGDNRTVTIFPAGREGR